jgi:uncharacterized protein YbaR (Trm112 family)
MEFSWARLQWLGFKRSYLIGVGKISCEKCGRMFPIEESAVQKFKDDLRKIALEQL